MVKSEFFRRQIYCIEKTTCDIVGTFRCLQQQFGAPAVIQHPHSELAPGELCSPCPPCYTPVCELYFSVVTNRELSKTAKHSVFKSVFVPILSSPVVMNLRWRMKKYCQKKERQRWDICEEFSMWHFVTKSTGLKSVKPGKSSQFSESRYPNYCMLVWLCFQNVPGKNGEISPSGYSLHQQESGQEVVQGTGDVSESPTLLGPVLVWSSQNYLRLLLIVRYFGSFQGCCPRLSPKEKRARKWVNGWVCRPTLKLSIYELVISLFAKSECHIQIIKHNWTEMCVFVKIS